MRDPLRPLMTLPGEAMVFPGVAALSLRGTQPAETGYFYDGVELPQHFHLFAGPSPLFAGRTESVSLYRGEAPLERGRYLQGAVDVAPKPLSDAGEAQLDLINAGAIAGGQLGPARVEAGG